MTKGGKAAPKMAKRERKQYSKKKRDEILAVAAKEHLTALQVQKRFGVKPVTYYSWRKKTGLTRRRGGRTAVRAGSGHLRAEVRAKMRKLLPGIIRAELARYLDRVLGTARRRRGRKA